MSQNRFHQTDAVAAMIKRKAVYLGCILFLLAMGRPAAAQLNFVPGITTIAGGTYSSTGGGDGGLATGASLNTPQGATYDNAGNLYISDGGAGVVRKVAPNGIITTFAGNGTSGFGGDGGPATSAQLFNPTGIAVDGAGNVYICDTGNDRIRKIDAATGTINTIAGIGGNGGFSGDNGPATAAQLNGPLYLAFDLAGNLNFTDFFNDRVRKITMSSGVITTVAGNGTAATAGDGGLATSASLNGPQGVAIDTAGNLYISEAAGNVVREVAASTGDISTFAGNGTAGFFGDGGAATSAQLNDPYGLAFDATVDGLLISDANNNSVRLVNLSTGNITTVAGNGNSSGGFSGDGGPATSAQFSFPEGAVADASGNLVVVDTFNSAVRELTLANLNFPTTNIGSSSVTRNLQLETTTSETITSISVPQSQGGLQEYSIGTITGCTVGASNPANTICNIPITFTPAYPGERWIPIEVVTSTGSFNFGLQGIGVGPLVTLAPGIISTVAGTTAGFSGDGGAATSAKLSDPFYVSVDSAGNLYIADRGNDRVRKVDAVTGIITTVAGNGTAGFLGDGGPATSAELNGAVRIAIDGVGNLYIADFSNQRIRKVDAATGIITTVAGNGTAGFTGHQRRTPQC
jgi:trimeric autotransporter adhesin